ncbi:MAG: HPr family phosphocarrier protein [Treponema sp.]|uniref:HPr family phosphocarrier protein n=1 Tax=Treponema sp. TaxID=166 RepID=UPI001B5E3AB7|nr:HPr family phosphocarrier protein [Treponema sp.]MBQ0003737.1 HPr family phosphocarrier protein [Candidatus Treponema merdequi]MBP5588841.1 HPr family phosphocarrier protein [Treponema sp.]MBR0155674.1 HPr family phosphocarrier protein [Treponema sp.]MBR5933951.1 HPr family phosphocarrier protein [Treponema sp.]MCR5386632.1 HPr family phosphocarrier protein [Treponema sp.]
MVEKILTVKNRAGIHARPATLIAQLANKFTSEITLEKDSIVVNAKSIMGVITMAAGYNTTMTLKVEGPDESEAASAIENLFDTKFDDE